MATTYHKRAAHGTLSAGPRQKEYMQGKPSNAKVIMAFAVVYIVWGSTYLAIRFAIDTIPPFLMAATRFGAAGALIYGWSRLRQPDSRPTRREWRDASIIGALLLLGGNGAVVWAEQTVPSGVTALLVAVTPCFMVLLDWLWRGAARPGLWTMLGLLLGFGGIALLIGPDGFTGNGAFPIAGVFVLMIGSITWSIGSIYSKLLPPPADGLRFTGMQMLAGAALLVLAGAVNGEFARFDASSITMTSFTALVYLTLFGSIIGYSTYIWLLRASTPARVSTYAYVNPVVAMILGWLMAGEVFTLRMAVAALVIVGGVALITAAGSRRAEG